jgi:hypothetical protein
MNGRVVLVTSVAGAGGSKAAAAALACAASEPDRPGLLVDVGGRAPRPTLIASAGARQLEERLAAHLPRLRAASRGQACHLVVPDDPEGLDGARAALPLVRNSIAVVHVSPASFRRVLEEPGIEPSGVLLRADLGRDSALTALAVGDLLGRDLCVRVLKRPLAWVAARRALFGVLPPDAPGGLPLRLRKILLESQISVEHPCYAEADDEKADAAGTAERQREDHESARWRRGFHRDPQREAGR